MPTLLLSPRYTSDSQTIRSAADAAGWQVVRLSSRRLPDWVDDRDLAFYGEPGFMDGVAQAAGIGLLCPSPEWLALLPSSYRKRDVRHTTLGRVRALITPSFVKPALEEKVFPAAVYADSASLSSVTTGLSDRLPVLVATPVQWEVEYRSFILNRCIVALSPSLRLGVSAQAADGIWRTLDQELLEARAFLTGVLADPAVSLPSAVVVDVW